MDGTLKARAGRHFAGRERAVHLKTNAGQVDELRHHQRAVVIVVEDILRLPAVGVLVDFCDVEGQLAQVGHLRRVGVGIVGISIVRFGLLCRVIRGGCGVRLGGRFFRGFDRFGIFRRCCRAVFGVGCIIRCFRGRSRFGALDGPLLLRRFIRHLVRHDAFRPFVVVGVKLCDIVAALRVERADVIRIEGLG